MKDEIKKLGKVLKELSGEDLEQIAGSGDANSVYVTDRQCEKIKEKYRTMFDLMPYDQTDPPVIVTNYGGVYPREVFRKAIEEVSLDDDSIIG